jgi:hypothetical protein
MHVQRSDTLCKKRTREFWQMQADGLMNYLQSDLIKTISDDKTLVVLLNLSVSISDPGDTYYTPRDIETLKESHRAALYGDNPGGIIPASAQMTEKSTHAPDDANATNAWLNSRSTRAHLLLNWLRKKITPHSRAAKKKDDCL